MSEQELKNLAEELFYIFSLVNPVIRSENSVSERTAKVLAFEKYILKQAKWQIIRKYCAKFTKADMRRFQKIVSVMTAQYLNQNAKTLALY